MRLLKHVFLAATILAAVGLDAPASRAADGPIIMKFPFDTTPQQLKGIAAERMRKMIAERLKGKVELQLFPAGQLFAEEVQALQALQAGAIQLVSPTFAKWTPLMPEFALFELPYAVTSAEMMKELVKSPEIGGKLFNKKLREKNLVGVALGANGFRQMFTRKTPIQTLEDYKGLKLRIQPSAMFASFIKAAGASSQAMGWAEVYTAISSGVVDGAEAPFDGIWGAKLYEVAPHISVTDHVFSAYLMAVNARWWDKLPADIRTELQKIFDETAEWQWGYIEQLQAESQKKLLEHGAKIHTIDPAEKARMVKHFRKVHQEFAKTVGEDNLKALYAIQDKYM
jgi:C4-dicarboxylate-binding protein DctP